MVYSDCEPPTESSDNEFPVLSSVVTVDNCWYYLSLLERFVQMTKDMEEDVLKLYLVRAEYRYFKWIEAYYKVWWEKDTYQLYSIPPMDVAYFWQAHLLSPLRYRDDYSRSPALGALGNKYLPLKQIHQAATDDSVANIGVWRSLMGLNEPYHLTLEKLTEKSRGCCAVVNCVVCDMKMDVSWEGYVEWRTDHTVALQCYRCDAVFTVKHAGKVNCVLDIRKRGNVAGFWLGTKSSSSGWDDIGHREIFNVPYSRSLSVPFNEGFQDLVKDALNECDRSTNIPRKKKEEKKKLILDAENAIKSTYLCAPYRHSSIDLLYAVARQYKFAYNVTHFIHWDIPGAIVRGIRQYSQFLLLIKENRKAIVVPTFEIDLAWHTHMLHHVNYYNFTTKFIGRHINHDDAIPDSELKKYADKTNQLWIARARKKKLVAPFKELSSLIKKSAVTSAEERYFEYAYVPGSFETTAEYDPRNMHTENSNETTTRAKKDLKKEDISFHDKRDVKEFISFKNSEEVIDKKFDAVKRGAYGFIGTSNCGNTDYLNRWQRPTSKTEEQNEKSVTTMSKAEPNIQKDDTEMKNPSTESSVDDKKEWTYTKVIGSTGRPIEYNDKINWFMRRNQQYIDKKLLSFPALDYQADREPRPNPTIDGTFDWYEVRESWEYTKMAASTICGTRTKSYRLPRRGNRSSSRAAGRGGNSGGGSGGFSSCGSSCGTSCGASCGTSCGGGGGGGDGGGGGGDGGGGGC